MKFNFKTQIENIFSNNGISINPFGISTMEDIGFNFENLQILIELFKKEEIKINSIELFKKDTKKQVPPDFWYNHANLENCYNEIKKYLDTIVDKNSLFFTISLLLDEPKSIELKISLDKILLDKKG